MRIMDVVGESELLKLKGKYIRIAHKGLGSTVEIIGNIIKISGLTIGHSLKRRTDMHIFEDEKTDRFGNYPIWIKGKDANPQKIHEELYRRYGGQGYKFAIVFDCSADEWENPEKETPVYFLDTILDELIFYCGPEEVRRRWMN